jgi:bifunctional DNA-binding transcriptional regulator/antitoxin component of YhaV-PrlF toxin-antitoxin module
MDRHDRVVLPKLLRDELHLVADDTLELESFGERDGRNLGPGNQGRSCHRNPGNLAFLRNAENVRNHS